MPLTIETSSSGVEDIISALSMLADNGLDVMAAALYTEAEDIMRDSADNYVPVAMIHGGTLRGTGFVDPPVITGDGVEIRLHYGGGPAAAYAVVQHENLDFNHPGQGQAKYLEIPMLYAIEGMGERLAERFAAEIFG